MSSKKQCLYCLQNADERVHVKAGEHGIHIQLVNEDDKWQLLAYSVNTQREDEHHVHIYMKEYTGETQIVYNLTWTRYTDRHNPILIKMENDLYNGKSVEYTYSGGNIYTSGFPVRNIKTLTNTTMVLTCKTFVDYDQTVTLEREE
jgi:hypothetical protein